ncbi:ketopantoate reductase family protein [Microbacterium sp. MPKO10]|uniref:ketopantoate reductase family protein n=1 Tax=Microbacterium sp. MPKO10 TaxID=2989818 RepID=UPI002236AFA7|nr:2-dehydropantoate 2-reductase N-terminal domain-containing protein [Microbacterium sp. MPKO10]MCW4458009.1 ketopantoate reductase [Microbacterium sp. MPKO10]
MRVLMFGRGVIATIYGQALESAGHDVEFYVRPGRAAEYGKTVRLDLIDARHSPLGRRISRTVPVKIRESVEQEDGFDLVILSVAHHQLASAAAYLAPRVGNATVLILGNMWEEPLAAVAPLPPAQVVFGFPQAGGGFGTDGILHGAVFRTVIIEADNGKSKQRHAAVQNAFRQAGFTIRRQRDMRGWLLLHFVADAGMHAQGVHHRGLAGLIGNRRGLREALLTTRELLPILRARGIDLSHHRRALLPFRFPVPTAAAMAWATAHLPIAQVSLSAHTDPDAAEARAVLRDTLHEAQRLGVHAHRLEESLGAPAKSADI